MKETLLSDGWHLIGNGFDAGPFASLEQLETFREWMAENQARAEQ